MYISDIHLNMRGFRVIGKKKRAVHNKKSNGDTKELTQSS
jgi:hypothetical protein